MPRHCTLNRMYRENMTRTTHTYTDTVTHIHKRRKTVPKREKAMTIQDYEEQRTGKKEERRKKRGLHNYTGHVTATSGQVEAQA